MSVDVAFQWNDIAIMNYESVNELETHLTKLNIRSVQNKKVGLQGKIDELLEWIDEGDDDNDDDEVKDDVLVVLHRLPDWYHHTIEYMKMCWLKIMQSGIYPDWFDVNTTSLLGIPSRITSYEYRLIEWYTIILLVEYHREVYSRDIRKLEYNSLYHMTYWFLIFLQGRVIPETWADSSPVFGEYPSLNIDEKDYDM